MFRELPLFPETASTSARHIDHLFFFLIGVSGFFGVLIFVLILFFAIKFRQRAKRPRAEPVSQNTLLEATWIGIPAMLTVVMFVWGARVFVNVFNPPANAMEIYTVGKQWMWKFQHPEGRREINELHVPRGQPVRMTMISEDVIHSFFAPAFRVHKDVLPARYTTVWFQATRPGRYHLFCSQYCGTQHSKMGGWIYAMEPADYARWLSEMPAEGEPLATRGGRLFQQLGCASCHRARDTPNGPSLVGFFGRRVRLRSGETIFADENYFRESLMNPNSKITAGYAPLMPTFRGLVGEEGVQELIAYIKALDTGKEKP
jgi:cytochrome c oxidase subunit 2